MLLTELYFDTGNFFVIHSLDILDKSKASVTNYFILMLTQYSAVWIQEATVQHMNWCCALLLGICKWSYMNLVLIRYPIKGLKVFIEDILSPEISYSRTLDPIKNIKFLILAKRKEKDFYKSRLRAYCRRNNKVWI